MSEYPDDYELPDVDGNDAVFATTTTSTSVPTQRHGENTLQQKNLPQLGLGVVTWNVAHFSSKDITLRNTAQVVGAALKALDEAKQKTWLTNVQDWLTELTKSRARPLNRVFKKKQKKEESTVGKPKQGSERVAALAKLKAEEFAKSLHSAITVFQQEWASQQDETNQRKRLFEKRKRLMPALRSLRELLRALDTRAKMVEQFEKAKKSELPAPKIATPDAVGEALALYKKVITLDQTAHKCLVVMHIGEMFKANQWLDLMVLQEVNAGIEVLRKELKAYNLQLDAGPHLQSTTELWKKEKTARQHEYYPVIFRADGGFAVTKRLCVFNDGRVEEGFAEKTTKWWDKNNPAVTTNTRGGKRPRHERGHYANMLADDTESHGPKRRKNDSGKNSFFKVEKSDTNVPSGPVYRPIVVYEMTRKYEKRSEAFSVGVVHTTPFGSEFSRTDVFGQVQTPLSKLVERTTMPFLVGGDYYLTAEATVVNWTSLPKEQKRESTAEHDKLEKQLKAKAKEVFKDQVDLQGVKLPESLHALHVLRNELKITVQAKVEDLQLRIEQPLTGTNLKPKPQRLAWPIKNEKQTTEQKRIAELTIEGQIADFFIGSSHWQTRVIGLLRPDGGLLRVDAPDLRFARDWRLASDHFPVVAYFSTITDDPTHAKLLDTPKDAKEAATKMQEKRALAKQTWEIDKITPEMFLDEFEGKDDGWLDTDVVVEDGEEGDSGEQPE